MEKTAERISNCHNHKINKKVATHFCTSIETSEMASNGMRLRLPSSSRAVPSCTAAKAVEISPETVVHSSSNSM